MIACTWVRVQVLSRSVDTRSHHGMIWRTAHHSVIESWHDLETGFRPNTENRAKFRFHGGGRGGGAADDGDSDLGPDPPTRGEGGASPPTSGCSTSCRPSSPPRPAPPELRGRTGERGGARLCRQVLQPVLAVLRPVLRPIAAAMRPATRGRRPSSADGRGSGPQRGGSGPVVGARRRSWAGRGPPRRRKRWPPVDGVADRPGRPIRPVGRSAA